MTTADDLQNRWYGDRAPPMWTRPLAALYRVVAAARRRMYHHGWLRSEQLPVPVIVVGNVLEGCAGKIWVPSATDSEIIVTNGSFGLTD